ncbi:MULTISPECIES: hypothetical protein [Nocardioides]|uniref:Uncharacterized protein n=1 Tax=Nocardioides vastitatis TaxID=2568655 RepID=A0ABW0ZAP2_9ACTN|nr:hypothetical protein [Nocardioides sp.]THI99266.1 hypothetical protein E7Z54_12870 [Nocardioides sp.]
MTPAVAVRCSGTPGAVDATTEHGSRTEVASSGNAPGLKEEAMIADPRRGPTSSRSPTTRRSHRATPLTAALFDATDEETSGLIEAYTLTCEKAGKVLGRCRSSSLAASR